MSTESLAQPARTTTTHDQLAERLERELSRIRRYRPQLADRCDRAADLLATHLSCPGKVIRVRVKGSRARFLVNSLNERGVTYLVDPVTWSCSCPDHHRRDAACKHGIACFALTQATAPRAEECPPCRGDGKVWIGESIEDPDTGELTERITGLPCSRCGGKGVIR